VTSYTDSDLWNDQIATPAGRLIFGWDPGDERRRRSNPEPAPHAVRLGEAKAERSEIAAAAKRIADSKDPRAAAAREALADALARADARVAFLASIESSFKAAELAFREALDECKAATHRLGACEPDDAAGCSIELATAQARIRAAIRAGIAILDGWRQSAAPVAPELAACLARAATLQTAIDALRAAGRDDDVLAVACEPTDSKCDHWRSIIKARAARTTRGAAA